MASGCGEHQGPGEIEGARVPAAAVEARTEPDVQAARSLAAGEAPAKQILFGDLHVHTTFSADAFMMGLPILQGEGAHPIADACDYARYCSALDFWAITDHAEGITPQRWQRDEGFDPPVQRHRRRPAGSRRRRVPRLGVDADRHDARDPLRPQERDPARHRAPRRCRARPIHSGSFAAQAMRQGLAARTAHAAAGRRLPEPPALSRLLPVPRRAARDAALRGGRRFARAPRDCSEGADTPEELFAKLDQWGFAALVIPHGTTWGFYTPPGSTWDKQLNAAAARSRAPDADRGLLGPRQLRGVPRLPGGRVRRERQRRLSRAAGRATRRAAGAPARSSARAARSRTAAMLRGARRGGARELPSRPARAAASPCRARRSRTGTTAGSAATASCRPSTTGRRARVQYIMALSNFDGSERRPDALPLRLHRLERQPHARGPAPATRRSAASRTRRRAARATRSGTTASTPACRAEAPPRVASPSTSRRRTLQNFQVLDFERQASFFLTGGLVAVHAEGRGRDSIWDALQRREVYGTSGDRILLWFDLLNGPTRRAADGRRDAARRGAALPRARGRRASSRRPAARPRPPRRSRPSASTRSAAASASTRPTSAAASRASRSCASARRRQPGEPIGELIEDPWRTIPCPGDPAGCSVEFDDPDFAAGGREALYYVRAIQEPTLDGEREPRALHHRRDGTLRAR